MKRTISRLIMMLILASLAASVGCGGDTILGAGIGDMTDEDAWDIDAFSSDAHSSDAHSSDALFAPDTESTPDTGWGFDAEPEWDAEREWDAEAEFDAGFDAESDTYADASPDADEWDDTWEEPPSKSGRFDCPKGTTVGPGWNSIEVGGTTRRYHIDLPINNSRPPAIVFAFHGYSGPIPGIVDVVTFRAEMLGMGIRPDARPDMPFILVMLQDTNLQPIWGLDWDIRTHNPNRDIALFESVVGCLVEHQQADEDRVFAFGFSAGATIANLIHSVHPDVLRAFATASGLWPNERNNLRIANSVTLGIPIVNWNWPALAPIERGSAAILLTRGGPNDLVPGSPVPASLNDAGQFARDALVRSGRVVADCPHFQGHTIHPNVRGDAVLEFFAAHTSPGISPLMYEELPRLMGWCGVWRP